MIEQKCVCRTLNAAVTMLFESQHDGSSFEYLWDLYQNLTPIRNPLMNPAQKSCSTAWQGRFEVVRIESSAVRPKASTF